MNWIIKWGIILFILYEQYLDEYNLGFEILNKSYYFIWSLFQHLMVEKKSVNGWNKVLKNLFMDLDWK